MKVVFAFVGGQKEEWLKEVTSLYLKKIGFYLSAEILQIRPSKIARGSSQQKVAEESESIKKVLRPDDFLIVCDERGEQLSSIDFSKKVVRAIESGKSRIVFLVGGAFGLSDELKNRSNLTLSLSTLVFNHHIAQAVLLEQVYRACTIWKNIPYHNE